RSYRSPSAHARARVRVAAVDRRRARDKDTGPRSRPRVPAASARTARAAHPRRAPPVLKLPSSMDLAACRYIVIEGPIGAGKTSLARELAHRLHAEELLEQPDENPFLARFYDDMARFALPTQLTFLFQRADQLRGLAQLDLFRRPTVADFLLDKDPLFARINLSDEEYALYDKVFSHLKPQTPTPDLVVYLQAPVDTLIERVHRRGIDFEQSIPAEYLARLADAYTRFFYQYSEAPLLIVNSERLNFVDDATHVDLLLGRVASMRSQREFFNLGPA